MSPIRAAALLFVIAPLLNAQAWPAANPYKQGQDRNKLVELAGIEVTGSRLPAESVIRLSGLKVGQMVNYDILTKACDRITSTGLVSTVDYAYNVKPGTPGVVVSFKLWDEQSLLPVTIYPEANAELLWGCLQAADPIFTREMPNTKAAIRFYTANIDTCLQNGSKNNNFFASPTTACDIKGKAERIVFNIKEREPGATASSDDKPSQSKEPPQ